jgi:hypothetical protein
MQTACTHAVHTAPEPPQTWQAFHSTARIHSCCRGSTIASDRCAKSSGPPFAHGPHRHFSADGFGILTSAAARGHTARTRHVHRHVRERAHQRQSGPPHCGPLQPASRAVITFEHGLASLQFGPSVHVVRVRFTLRGGNVVPRKGVGLRETRQHSRAHGVHRHAAACVHRTPHRTPVVGRQWCAHLPARLPRPARPSS